MDAREPRIEDRVTRGYFVGTIIAGAVCLAAVALAESEGGLPHCRPIVSPMRVIGSEDGTNSPPIWVAPSPVGGKQGPRVNVNQ